MLGDLLDRAISVLAPATAARRQHARSVYRQGLQRGYDGARTDRLNAHWKAGNFSADLELLADADKMRARARDLVRNNPYARGILRALVRNVVGEGIIPQPRVRKADGEMFERFNERASELWARWQREADVAGRMTFYEIQQLVEREVHEAGEVLIRFVSLNDPTRVLPLALEVIEADRLANDRLFPRGVNRETGNEVRRGVEINAAGQTVAYWLYPSHPNDLNLSATQSFRHDASGFLHLYHQDRIGQTRGATSFAPIIRSLKNLNYYEDNELQASAVSSCFSAVIKTMDGGAGDSLSPSTDADSSDDRGNQFEFLEPGIVARLMPGEDISTINPTRPNSQAEPWINLMLRSMAVAMGLSFERLTRDYSETNFSSNRASDLEDRREFRMEQRWLIRHLCEATWERFLISAVAHETQGFPTAREYLNDPARWNANEWQAPGWEWVDPRNQATAAETELKNNLTTFEKLYGDKGLDWRSQLRQRQREQQFVEELSLKAGDESQDGNANDDEDDDAQAEGQTARRQAAR